MSENFKKQNNAKRGLIMERIEIMDLNLEKELTDKELTGVFGGCPTPGDLPEGSGFLDTSQPVYYLAGYDKPKTYFSIFDYCPNPNIWKYLR
jgi:hypothetical protein